MSKPFFTPATKSGALPSLHTCNTSGSLENHFALLPSTMFYALVLLLCRLLSCDKHKATLPFSRELPRCGLVPPRKKRKKKKKRKFNPDKRHRQNIQEGSAPFRVEGVAWSHSAGATRHSVGFQFAERSEVSCERKRHGGSVTACRFMIGPQPSAASRGAKDGRRSLENRRRS